MPTAYISGYFNASQGRFDIGIDLHISIMAKVLRGADEPFWYFVWARRLRI